MKILLLGEYSNVHRTLRDALRRKGHDVLLISNGDGWKDYPRDISLKRSKEGSVGSAIYIAQLLKLLPKMRGFDVVQLINPDLLQLKPRWNRWFFQYLKRNNRVVSVGCFGDDYYVIKRSQKEYVELRQRAAQSHVLPPYLDYTDFYAKGTVIDHPLNQQRIQGWLHSGKADLTKYVMAKADCLIACLYEYYKVYDTEEFRQKIHYIPLPIDTSDLPRKDLSVSYPIRILLAIQKLRSAMKGTDQMYPVFQRLADDYPDKVRLQCIESVPFAQYCQMLDDADVVVDQLYSYTPAMNALESMSRGKIVVSGGEEDYYQFLQQQYPDAPGLRPIINMRPFEQDQNYTLLRECLLNPDKVAQMRAESIDFVKFYHNADQVAAQYLEVWQKILK